MTDQDGLKSVRLRAILTAECPTRHAKQFKTVDETDDVDDYVIAAFNSVHRIACQVATCTAS